MNQMSKNIFCSHVISFSFAWVMSRWKLRECKKNSKDIVWSCNDFVKNLHWSLYCLEDLHTQGYSFLIIVSISGPYVFSVKEDSLKPYLIFFPNWYQVRWSENLLCIYFLKINIFTQFSHDILNNEILFYYKI